MLYVLISNCDDKYPLRLLEDILVICCCDSTVIISYNSFIVVPFDTEISNIIGKSVNMFVEVLSSEISIEQFQFIIFGE